MDGIVLTFDVFGVYQGAFVMADRETGTVWAHLTGEALAGPLAGRRLLPLPVTMTSFGAWLNLHPDSLAPDPGVMVRPITVRPGQRRLRQDFAATLEALDRRLDPHALVVGVQRERTARAYVLDPDRPGPTIHHDRLDGKPIVLLAPPGAWPLAYAAEARDERGTTSLVDLRLDGESLVDADGSTWSWHGHALRGPRAGATLSFIASHVTEWYAWAAYHPDTEISSLAFPFVGRDREPEP